MTWPPSNAGPHEDGTGAERGKGGSIAKGFPNDKGKSGPSTATGGGKQSEHSVVVQRVLDSNPFIGSIPIPCKHYGTTTHPDLMKVSCTLVGRKLIPSGDDGRGTIPSKTIDALKIVGIQDETLLTLWRAKICIVPVVG